MTKILVLGGTRFIGKAVLNKLKGVDLFYFHRGINNLSSSNTIISTEIIGNRNNEADIKMLYSQGFDVVIDISGESFEFVQKSIKYAKSKVDRYVFISSSSVYDNDLESDKAHVEQEDISESNKEQYTIDKIKSERLIQESFDNYAIIRPSKVYGHDNHIYREQFYYDRIVANESIFLFKDPILHFTYVEDLAEAIINISLSTHNGIFNIAGKEPAHLSDFIRIIGVVAKQSPIIIYADRSDAPFTNLHTCILDCEKSKKLCNWEPKYSLLDGLSKTFYGE